MGRKRKEPPSETIEERQELTRSDVGELAAISSEAPAEDPIAVFNDPSAAMAPPQPPLDTPPDPSGERVASGPETPAEQPGEGEGSLTAPQPETAGEPVTAEGEGDAIS